MRSLLAFLIACLFILPAQAKYAGGTGEPNDPYLIYTAEQMNAIGAEPNDWDKHFKLMADVDLGPLAGTEFNIIGYWHSPSDYRPFIGVFDGDGHRILHFNYSHRADEPTGLFGYVDDPNAEVKNLTLVDPNVDAENAEMVASLVGYFRLGTVSNCHAVDGRVLGKYAVGGLVGFCYRGVILDSSSSGSIAGRSGVGGLVGSCEFGEILRCCSTGTAVSHDSVGGLVGTSLFSTIVANCYSIAGVSGDLYVGGLVGGLGLGARVTNCYSGGAVSGTEHVGGLIGFGGNIAGYKPDVESSFWDIEASGQTRSVGGAGKTTAEMQMSGSLLTAGWDFVSETDNGTEDVWWILEGRDYPRLWWERVLGDDFEDGKPEPLWMVYEVDPNLVQIKEVNGRLETTASAQAQNVDAFYVSDGWRLDATKDFAIRVDFHFSKHGGGDGRVTLGVVPGLDPSAMQWAEFEAGCFDTGPFYLYEVRDGAWVQEQVTDRSADSGTLYLSYDPDTDELYFSPTGYGKPNAWQTVTGLLKDRWAGQPLYVILGGGSEGMKVEADEAWLDNFAVDAGTVLQ